MGSALPCELISSIYEDNEPLKWMAGYAISRKVSGSQLYLYDFSSEVVPVVENFKRVLLIFSWVIFKKIAHNMFKHFTGYWDHCATINH